MHQLKPTSSLGPSIDRPAGLEYSREGTRGLRSLEHLALWRRIEGHAFDASSAGETFENRLAAEQGWTAAFARRAIDEYRRYAFIYGVDGRAVSPPPAVNLVWRLHLIYTRNYWDVFCNDVLDRPLHHDPGAIAATDQAVLDVYASTVARYRLHFGEPPTDLWPDPIAMAAAPQPKHRWVDIDDAVVLPRVTLYAIAGLVAAMIVILIATLMDGQYMQD